MKKTTKNTTRLAIIYLMAVIMISLFSQGMTQPVNDTIELDSTFIWDKTWGGQFGDYGYSLWNDKNNIYTFGSTELYIEDAQNWHTYFSLIKWDMDGNIVWNTTWGKDSVWSRGNSLWSDGNYLYGLGITADSKDIDFALVKWDMDGNVIWDRVWGGENRDSPSYIYGQGNYLYTTGYTNLQFTDGVVISYSDLVLIKWDMDGNIVWNATWGGDYADWGSSIWINNNYIYTSGALGVSSDKTDLSLIKWDMDGNIVWNTTQDGGYSDWGTSIWSNDNFIYTLGETESLLSSRDFSLIKWDMDGNVIWDRVWGGEKYDVGRSLWSDGNYLYGLGETTSFGTNNYYQFALVKWDMDGNVIWDRVWGEDYDDWGYSIQGDKDYLYLLGSTYSDTTSFDLALMKIDVNAPVINSPANISYQESDTGNSIIWNPTDSDPSYYSVTNSYVVIESKVWVSGDPITINVDELSPGSYNYTITIWDTSGNTISDTVIVRVTASNITTSTDTTSTDTTSTDTTSTDTTSTDTSVKTETVTETLSDIPAFNHKRSEVTIMKGEELAITTSGMIIIAVVIIISLLIVASRFF